MRQQASGSAAKTILLMVLRLLRILSRRKGLVLPQTPRLMKRFCLLLPVICLSLTLHAQVKFFPVDKSPLDMIYYPSGYPVLKIQDKASEPLMARALFSRPQKNGRPIFGELVEYGKLWRTGANEATELEFFQNVKLGKTKIKKGRYTLFCIPYEKKWTIIINQDTDTWGAFKYDEKKDVARLDVPVTEAQEPIESFSMAFEKSTVGFNLWIGWDNAKVSVPFSL
jgi:hypothetical protein